MKKTISSTVLVAIALLTGCEKEIVRPATIQPATPAIEKIDTPKYTTVSCETIDPEGHKGMGTRCRKAPGDDCKKVTGCKEMMLPVGFVLPDGWSLDRFNDAWDTDEGTAYLEGLGYYQQDVE